MAKRRANKRKQNKRCKDSRRKARSKPRRKKQAPPATESPKKLPTPNIDQPPGDVIAALTEQLFHGEAAKDLERKLRRQISHLEPISAAARVAGLMTCPELGANACRLEALLVEVLQHARGGEQLDDESLQDLFRFMDSTAHARMEDPAEDVFVSLVIAWSHNFRIFEGTYEGNAFHLQRFLDAVASMPREAPFEQMHRSIRALLLLSETVADRAGIGRYTPGGELPCEEIPEEIVPRLSTSLEVVRFTSDQLNEFGISLPDLHPYLTKLKDWQGHSHTPDLEITPLLQHEGTIYVLSQSHISPAIRRHVISFCAGRNELTNLQSAIAGVVTRRKLKDAAAQAGSDSRLNAVAQKVHG